MQQSITRITLVIIFLCSFINARSASASALYFEKAVVRTSSEAICLRFASDVAYNQGFRNVHKGSAEAAGEKDGAYVAITCVGRGQQSAIAVVMSISSTFDIV